MENETVPGKPDGEKRKRRGCGISVLVGSLVVLGIAVAVWLLGPKSIEIGPSKNPLHFRAMKDLDVQPWVDFRLRGNRYAYPAWVPKIDATKLSRETAGVIFIEVNEQDDKDMGGVRWRIDGKEVYVDPYGVDAPHLQLGWDYAAVPFARSPDKRAAELWTLMEWVPVKLPYQADQVPGPMPTLSIQAGPFRVEAEAQERLARATTVGYVLSCPSQQSDLYLEGTVEVTGSSAGSYSDRFGTTIGGNWFGSKDWPVLVGRFGETRLTGRVHEVERIKVPIIATEDPSYNIIVKSTDGRVLIKDGQLHFKKLGFVALIYRDILVHDADQSGSQPVASMSPPEVIALRSLRSYPFSIRLTNAAP